MRDLLLLLDGLGQAERRTEAAILLARRFGVKRCLGLFAQCLPDTPSFMVAPSRPLAEIAAEAAERFRVRITEAGVPYVWRRRMCNRHSELLEEVSAVARTFDLTIVSPDTKDDTSQRLPQHLAEQLATSAGRPMLVIPPAGSITTVGTRVLVAWGGGHEAARSLVHAMPFLRGAEAVQLAMVGPWRRRHFDSSPEEDRNDLVDHLAEHGVRAETEQLASDDVNPMDLLLSRAAELGSDLIVLGAHPSHGFAHQRRGADTRYLLEQMTVPILLSA